MKTIGMIGGLSWESSAEYYRLINELVHARLGGMHSAKCILVSVDFEEIDGLWASGQWDEAARRMVTAACQVERAGADFLILCCNTMHKMAAEIEAAIHIPFLHITDAAAVRPAAQGVRRVGLLGTRFTMEGTFYTDRLKAHGLEALIPDEADRETVNRVIYDELCFGKTVPASREKFRAIMEKLVRSGAQGIILGCTEFGLLVKDGDASVPLFDTTRVHAEAAVDLALSEA